MKLFAREFNSLEDLLVRQLKDLYDTEARIAEALPEMAQAARSFELKRALVDHLDQTRGHIDRLDQVFGRLKLSPERESSDAIQGLLSQAGEISSAKGNPDVRDAALIAAAQAVEHYEIAAYGTARSFALRLGHTEAARLLETTLQEEMETDRKLTAMAESEINARAMQ